MSRPLKEANGKGTEKVGQEYGRRNGGVDRGIEGKAKRKARVRLSDKGQALEWLLAALLPFTLPQPPRRGCRPSRVGRRKHFAARTGSAVVWRFPSDSDRERTSWLFQPFVWRAIPVIRPNYQPFRKMAHPLSRPRLIIFFGIYIYVKH